MTATRASRDAEAVGAALEGLREAASRPGSSESNLMPHFLRCAEAYATLGEQTRVLREVFGEYREPVSVLDEPIGRAHGSTMPPCTSMPSHSSRTSAMAFAPSRRSTA